MFLLKNEKLKVCQQIARIEKRLEEYRQQHFLTKRPDQLVLEKEIREQEILVNKIIKRKKVKIKNGAFKTM